jgi:NTE family protein
MLPSHAPSLSPAPTIGLALGAGGARGLAHISVLEALDALGVRPAVIAGCSMGAVLGAAYAAGMTGKEIRTYVTNLLANRADIMTRVLRSRNGRFWGMWRGGLDNPVMLDGERFLDLCWPSTIPDRFEHLRIPLMVVATDYVVRREVRFDAGPLTPAVAASMAIPGLISPVLHEGMILIDGGTLNPLPHDVLIGRANIIISVDVTGGPESLPQLAGQTQPPKAFEALLGATQMMLATMASQKITIYPPDVLITPPVIGFRALDFFRITDILAAGDSIQDAVKRNVAAAIERAVHKGAALSA